MDRRNFIKKMAGGLGLGLGLSAGAITDNISPSRTNQDLGRKTAEDLLFQGKITINEARALQDLEPLSEIEGGFLSLAEYEAQMFGGKAEDFRYVNIKGEQGYSGYCYDCSIIDDQDNVSYQIIMSSAGNGLTAKRV